MASPRDSVDWEPEETTRNDNGSRRVRDLYDPDAVVMLGKIARAVADCESKIEGFASAWNRERRERARARKKQTAQLAAVFGVIQVVWQALHQLGVLK